jgi:hypothetical protein
VFVLEIRSSASHGSINQDGHFQQALDSIEIEVKDSSARSGQWSFYDFPVHEGKPANLSSAIPRTASCYSCHSKNTAVENTFVQFYPTLYSVAAHKGTLKPGFPKTELLTSH